MIVEYRKRFLKELSKIPSGTRLKIEKFVFEVLPKAESVHEVGVIEQMKRRGQSGNLHVPLAKE